MHQRKHGEKRKSEPITIYIDGRRISLEKYLEELVEAENNAGWFPPNPHFRKDRDSGELARRVKDRFLKAVWSAIWAAFRERHCNDMGERNGIWANLDQAIPEVIPAPGVIRLVDHGGRCDLEGFTGFLAGLLVARLLPQFSETRGKDRAISERPGPEEFEEEKKSAPKQN